MKNTLNTKSRAVLDRFKQEDLQNLIEEIKSKLKKYGAEKVDILINIRDYHSNEKVNESNPVLVPTDRGFALLERVNVSL